MATKPIFITAKDVVRYLGCDIKKARRVARELNKWDDFLKLYAKVKKHCDEKKTRRG